MALDIQGLKNGLEEDLSASLYELFNMRDGLGPETRKKAAEEMAKRLAASISNRVDAFVKTGTVNTEVTVDVEGACPTGTVTGTGSGTGTGTIS